MCAPDLGFGRLRVALEQRLRAHHHAGDAVAALRRLLLDEGALHRTRACSIVPRPSTVVISRPSSSATGVTHENTALAVDHHRAGAALAEAAAELRAVQLEVVAQHVEQRRLGIGVDLVALAVDVEAYHLRLSELGLAGAVPIAGRRIQGRGGLSATRLTDDLAHVLPRRPVAEAAAQIPQQRSDLRIGQAAAKAGHDRAALAGRGARP